MMIEKMGASSGSSTWALQRGCLKGVRLPDPSPPGSPLLRRRSLQLPGKCFTGRQRLASAKDGCGVRQISLADQGTFSAVFGYKEEILSARVIIFFYEVARLAAGGDSDGKPQSPAGRFGADLGFMSPLIRTTGAAKILSVRSV